jgi:hypothetical protein
MNQYRSGDGWWSKRIKSRSLLRRTMDLEKPDVGGAPVDGMAHRSGRGRYKDEGNLHGSFLA